MTKKKTDKGAGTKSAILVIAREIMYKEGYEELSMRKIANRLGFTATSLYYHYRNKEEIVSSLVEESRQRLALFIKNRIKKYPNVKDVIIQGFVAYIDFGLQNPEDYKIMFMNPFPSEISDRLKISVTDKIEPSAFDTAEKISEFNPKLKHKAIEIVHVIWLLLHGYVSVKITSREDIVFNDDKVYQNIIATIENIISAQ